MVKWGMTRRGRVGQVGLALMLAATMLLAAAPASADAVYISEQPLDGWDTNGTVYAVEIVGNIAYIGGDFTTVRSPISGTQSRSNLAAIDITTGEITSFRSDTNSVVRAIDGNSATLWIGGMFTTINGISRNRLAAIDTVTGAVRGVDPDVNGTVYIVKRHGSFVYFGGAFTSVGGTTFRRVARIDTSTGNLDTSWNPNPNANVRGLAIPGDGSRIYVGGSFTSISGVGQAYVAGLDPVTAANVGPAWGNLNYPVLDLAVTPSGDRLAGAVAGLGNRITVWNTSTGSQSWRIIVDGDVQAVSYAAGNFYFGFHDGYQGNQLAKLMSADVYTGALEPWQPAIPEFFGVWDIDTSSAAVVAGGVFTSVEGVNTRGVAIFPALPGSDVTPPTAPENLVVTAATATEISIGWDPAIDDVGVTTYTVYRDGFVVANTVDTFFTDTSVLPGITYSYQVTAGDAASNESLPAGPLEAMTSEPFVAAGDTWSYLDDGSDQGTTWRQSGFDASAWATGPAEFGFGDGGEATLLTPGAITYYFVKDFTVSGALLGDATLLYQRDDGIVVYVNGVEALRDNMPGGTITSSTTASTTVAGLDESTFFQTTVPASLFHIGVNRIAVEIHQRSAGSSDVSFDLGLFADVAGDSTPPSVPQNLIETDVQTDSVSIQWDASTDDVAIKHYLVRRDGALVATTTGTSLTDSGLTPSTPYIYTVEAVDTSDNPSGESSALLVVTASPDTTPPSVPDGLTLVEATETTIEFSWNAATDDTAVAGYTVRRDGAILGTTTLLSWLDSGLTADTAYSYTVDAFDAVPNTSVESAALGVSTLPPDTSAPTIPADLAVTGVTATTVDLSWTASTDDRGVTEYIVRRDGVVVGNVATPGFTDTGLVPGTGYDYTVEAVDAAANASGQTAPVTGTTADDTTPPTTPTGLFVSGTGQTTVTLDWGPSTDDIAFDHYTVYRNGVPVGTPTTTGFTDTGLAWSTTYSYQVTATDVAGNESAPAGPIDATTDDNVVTTNLIVEGDVWRYLDDGSNQGTAWQGLAYDDSTWQTGAAQLGFGDGDETTVLQSGFITYYFRKTVIIDGTVTADATLRVLRDDAVAVHVNGAEVFRSDLPATYDYLTGATKTIAGQAERTFLETTVPAGAFVEGTNVIAVEIHQRNLSSSDVSFDLALTADVAVGIPDTTPPSVPGGLDVGSPTLDSLTLTWNPSSDDVGVALYVIRRDGAVIGSTGATSFVDTALASATTYSYTVAAQDAAANTSAESAPAEGTTLTPDTTPPSDPSGFSVDATTRTTIDISWIASTDDVGVAGYTVRVDGAIDGTTTATSYQITGLAAGTTYAITVQAFDAVGNTSAEVGSDGTTDPPDTTPPSDPSSLSVDATTMTTVTLSWAASTDDELLTGYVVRRDGVIVGSPVTTGFLDTGLAAATTYDYTVQAIDHAGNTSAQIPIQATTDADTTPPSIPSGLAVTDEQVDSITLDWNASTDDVGVVEYAVYRDGFEVARVPTPGFTDTLLPADTTFSYTVEAFDGAANASGQSAPVLGTTTVAISTQTLVAEGSVWKYLDDGSDQGTAWREVGFDDSSWLSGAAELGFGDGDEATVLQSGFVTYYFRTTITIDGTVVSDVELRYKRDDAAAIYVNGTLVELSNLPTTYNYLTGATTTVPNSLENAWVTTTIPASVFVGGTNVIAVEIHNRSASSSDITFDLSMTGDVQAG